MHEGRFAKQMYDWGVVGRIWVMELYLVQHYYEPYLTTLRCVIATLKHGHSNPPIEVVLGERSRTGDVLIMSLYYL